MHKKKINIKKEKEKNIFLPDLIEFCFSPSGLRFSWCKAGSNPCSQTNKGKATWLCQPISSRPAPSESEPDGDSIIISLCLSLNLKKIKRRERREKREEAEFRFGNGELLILEPYQTETTLALFVGYLIQVTNHSRMDTWLT